MKFKLYLFSALFASVPLFASGSNDIKVPAEQTGTELPGNVANFDDSFIKKTLPLKDFNKISVENEIKIYYTNGSKYSVEFEGSESDFNALSFDVYGKTLVIGVSSGEDGGRSCIDDCSLYITAPNITEISNIGSLNFYAKDMKTDSLTIANKSTMNLNIDNLKTGPLRIVNSGSMEVGGLFNAGSFNLKNRAAYSSDADLNVSGDIVVDNIASDASSGNIVARNVVWNCRGTDECDIDVSADKFVLNIFGSGHISGQFKGNAVNIKCNGSAQVDMNVDCSNLTAKVNGSGNLVLSGTADKTDIGGNGISRVDTSRLNNFD